MYISFSIASLRENDVWLIHKTLHVKRSCDCLHIYRGSTFLISYKANVTSTDLCSGLLVVSVWWDLFWYAKQAFQKCCHRQTHWELNSKKACSPARWEVQSHGCLAGTACSISPRPPPQSPSFSSAEVWMRSDGDPPLTTQLPSFRTRAHGYIFTVCTLIRACTYTHTQPVICAFVCARVRAICVRAHTHRHRDKRANDSFFVLLAFANLICQEWRTVVGALTTERQRAVSGF